MRVKPLDVGIGVLGRGRRQALAGVAFQGRFVGRRVDVRLGGLDGVPVIHVIGQDAELQAADAGNQVLYIIDLFAAEVAALARFPIVVLDPLLDLFARGGLIFRQVLFDPARQFLRVAARDVQVGFLQAGPFLHGFVNQFLPMLLRHPFLMGAASRQHDLDAGLAHRANGDVVQVIGIDAPLERGGQHFGPVVLRELAFGKAVHVHFVNQDGAADEVHAQPEVQPFAIGFVMVIGDAHDDRGREHRNQADQNSRVKGFHVCWVIKGMISSGIPMGCHP